MSEDWTEEELKDSVKTYLSMLAKHTDGHTFVKKRYYEDLNHRIKRGEKSIEYRMQNISYVFSLMGRPWLPGLRPAKNVGTKNADIIERLIFELEGQSFQKIAAFESEVSSYRSSGSLVEPIGIQEPSKTYIEVTQYLRDPKVKAWVLKEANGSCECCDNPAPFKTLDGEPFLEVHHLRRLADRGSDTPKNAVALCPNCHRELHFGENRTALIKSLYLKINRLVPE